MDEKELLAFINLYETKNVTATANKMYLTPQGVSLILKKLEAKLGVELFIRSNRGLRPTGAAHTLYPRATRLLLEMEDIKTNIKDLDHKDKYTLYVASMLGVIDYLTIRFVREYRESHPDVDIVIIENPDRAVKERILNGEAELGFLAGPIDTTLFKAIPFTCHHHCLVINKDDPLAMKESITYEDLDGRAIALEGRDFAPYHNNMNRFVKAGIKPNIIMETTEIVSTHKIAAMNEGIGLSVDFPAYNNIESATVIRPFADKDCTWETFIVTPASAKLSMEANEFISFALSWLKTNKYRLFHWPKPYTYLNEWYDK